MSEDYKLMEETLFSAYEYTQKMISGIDALVYNLQGGREDKAIPVCVDLFEGLKWLMETFELTLPYQSLKGVSISTEGIDDINVQIEEALENKDYVLLGDLMGYELLPVVNTWHDTIGLLLNVDKEN